MLLRSSVCLCCLIALGATAATPPRASFARSAAAPVPASAATGPGYAYALTAPTIRAQCAAAIARTKAGVGRIVASRAPRTFARTVLPLENAFADLNDETMVDVLEASVSTDAKARAASFACSDAQSALANAVNADPALYAALEAARASRTATTPADRKLTSLWIVALKRSGAELPPAQRMEVVSLGNAIANNQTKFAANLGNDQTKIHITSAQLAGLPSDALATYAKTGDGYDVAVNESTYEQFMRNAADSSARKAYYLAYNNRQAAANVPLLEATIRLRDRLAHVLGYPSWAAYQLADKMAQSPERVDTFLSALDAKLLPRARADLATLQALKNKDDPNGGLIAGYDTAFYDNELEKTTYDVDEHAISQYFPVAHVERAVFDIYEKLLGVRFTQRPKPDVWHEDVTQWMVSDAATGAYIGDFYLDLFPRPGKYDHFASFPLLPNRVLSGGRKRPPLDAIIGNWPKAAPGKPAVLTHADVETFFHEFGHDMATMLATAPYETLSAGFRADFIEAPSQMLENWVWDPAILKELSSNVTTGEPLPDATIAKMRAARYVNYALSTVNQIVYATVDMTYHSSGASVDTTAAWAKVQDAEGPLPLPSGIHPQAGFGHLMGGYDAGYYGYLWSKVYAQDLFSAFQAGGLESPVVGRRYRQDILEPARTIEPDAEVRAFLGRPMSPAAFYAEFDQIAAPVPGASDAPAHGSTS